MHKLFAQQSSQLAEDITSYGSARIPNHLTQPDFAIIVSNPINCFKINSSAIKGDGETKGQRLQSLNAFHIISNDNTEPEKRGKNTKEEIEIPQIQRQN